MKQSDLELDACTPRPLDPKGFNPATDIPYRSARIVPSPFFVSSDMTYPIQAADVCIYCVNHAFRIPGWGMNAPVRAEIQTRFGAYLYDLQFEGDGYKDGQVFHMYGITFVANPYGRGSA